MNQYLNPVQFRKSVVVMLAALNIFINASFYIPYKDPEFKVAKDFSFIHRYLCISDLFDKDQWHNNKGRSFDKNGVHLTNGKKHPVNSCHYALYCYDEYIRTGDKTLREGFIAQVKYLTDSSNYHYIDDDKIAYPYNITFHDLKPPWYSALAQSEAISVLIRYYALTKDASVLPIIIKLRNFMVYPQEGNCGTLSITPEGYHWYEEYPNSKQEKQVLNGFLITIIALYEYAQLFPENEEAKKQFEQSVITIKNTFKFYDTGHWLKYNRGDQRQVSNGYMKWQVLELKLLYSITGDIYFKDLMMLVSSYCYNKPYDTPGSKLKDYDFSIPLSEGKNNELIFTGKKRSIDMLVEVKNILNPFKLANPETSKLIDKNTNSFTILKSDSVRGNEYYLRFNFNNEQQIGSINISFTGNDSILNPEIIFYHSDTSFGSKRTRIKVTEINKDIKTHTYTFNTIKCRSLWMSFENLKKFKHLKISNVALNAPVEKVKSDYWHFITSHYKGLDEVSFNFKYRGMKDALVFYKAAKDIKNLPKELWKTETEFRKFPVKIKKEGEMYYKFLIITEPGELTAELKDLEFIP